MCPRVSSESHCLVGSPQAENVTFLWTAAGLLFGFPTLFLSMQLIQQAEEICLRI